MSEGLEAGLRRLAGFLRDVGRPAAIIGGIAVIARVGTRATRDVDVMISLAQGDVPALLETAVRHGYGFDPKERDLFDEGLIRLWPADQGLSGFGLDLILADVPYLERAIARATPMELAGVMLPVATIEDLVILKLEAGRAVDIEDLLAIKDSFASQLDRHYLETEAAALGIIEQLKLYFD